MLVCIPVSSRAGSGETSDSAYMSSLIHEENSLVASILYLPYMAAYIPYRVIDAIISPKPTSQATMPPAAHRAPGH